MEPAFTFEARQIDRRMNRQGCPWQIQDLLYLEPAHRLMCTIMWIRDFSFMPPLPSEGWYRFPYARSVRGQIHWRRMRATVHYPRRFYPTVEAP
jgi:hypothetical protein